MSCLSRPNGEDGSVVLVGRVIAEGGKVDEQWIDREKGEGSLCYRADSI